MNPPFFFTSPLCSWNKNKQCDDPDLLFEWWMHRHIYYAKKINTPALKKQTGFNTNSIAGQWNLRLFERDANCGWRFITLAQFYLSKLCFTVEDDQTKVSEKFAFSLILFLKFYFLQQSSCVSIYTNHCA